jgi:hypothetical protein
MAQHQPLNVDYDAPRIPMKSSSWFMQLMMALAALVLAGVVFGFWRMSRAASPVLDLPDSQTHQLPSNEQAP